MATPSSLLAATKKRIGLSAPINTCMQTIDKILADVGIPYDRNFSDGNGRAWSNVSDFHLLASRGLNGFRLVPLGEALPGDLLIWPQDSHITVFEQLLAGDRIVSIGGGGPSGKVARQPTGGGGNKRSYFIAAVRPPYEADHTPPVSVPAAGAPLAQTSAENDGVPAAIFWARLDRAMDREPFLGSGPKGEPGRDRDRAIVRLVARDVNDDGFLKGTHSNADEDGGRGPIYWKLVQRHSNEYFGTKLLIDGKPLEWSKKAEIKIAAWHLNRQ